MAKGWIGLDMKERRLVKFQLEDERNLMVGSVSLLSECEKVELPVSGFSEVPSAAGQKENVLNEWSKEQERQENSSVDAKR